MKLIKLYLKNFRGYENIEFNFNKNLNVIIGKNDIGKSTILEALDILLNGGSISIEPNDYNINGIDNNITIGAKFEVNTGHTLIIDSTNSTNLKEEYLLNENNELEIFKKWDYYINEDGKKKLSSEKVFLKARYPKNIDIPLIQLTISKLKTELNKLGITQDDINLTINAEIRKAIYNNIKISTFKDIDINLNSKEVKNIWLALQKELPLYSLFQSDRANKDTDGDVQNPLKTATKIAISDLIDEFEKLKNIIEERLTEIGEDTINKMKDMGIDISSNLKPLVNNKSWDSLFNFTLQGDDGISLNKRGSGFRRMVLLNYFRAEAEKQILERGGKSVIYSIEEPETSQHPDYQKLLIKALKELSERENHQIFLTTHTPEIAKMVNEENIIFLKKDIGDIQPNIIDNFDEKLTDIAKTLGILPTLDASKLQNVKLIICLEGMTDVEFLKGLNNIDELKSIIDLNSSDIILLPLGGSQLQYYINNRYLEKFNLPELHIYDSDINATNKLNQHKYLAEIKRINNSLGDDKFAFEMEKAEIENYLHPEIIKNKYNFDTIYHNGETDWLNKWSKELDIEKYVKDNMDTSLSISGKKKALAELYKELTKEYLEELEAFEEIKGWFLKIKELYYF